MRLEHALVELFRYPVAAIQDALPEASSPVWAVDEMRSKKFAVHRHTRSILFEWLENSWQKQMPVVVKHHDYAPPDLSEAVYACAAAVSAHIPGQMVKLMLAELAPGGDIPEHADTCMALTEVHRCHIPILTNPDVHFYIDGISHYLEAGKVYEFDNTRYHAVLNSSGERRVHLICDIMPPA